MQVKPRLQLQLRGQTWQEKRLQPLPQLQPRWGTPLELRLVQLRPPLQRLVQLWHLLQHPSQCPVCLSSHRQAEQLSHLCQLPHLYLRHWGHHLYLRLLPLLQNPRWRGKQRIPKTRLLSET